MREIRTPGSEGEVAQVHCGHMRAPDLNGFHRDALSVSPVARGRLLPTKLGPLRSEQPWTGLRFVAHVSGGRSAPKPYLALPQRGSAAGRRNRPRPKGRRNRARFRGHGRLGSDPCTPRVRRGGRRRRGGGRGGHREVDGGRRAAASAWPRGTVAAPVVTGGRMGQALAPGGAPRLPAAWHAAAPQGWQGPRRPIW